MSEVAETQYCFSCIEKACMSFSQGTPVYSGKCGKCNATAYTIKYKDLFDIGFPPEPKQESKWKLIDYDKKGEEALNGKVWPVTDGRVSYFAFKGEGWWHFARNGINISFFTPTHYLDWEDLELPELPKTSQVTE